MRLNNISKKDLIKIWIGLIVILIIISFDPINRGITRYSIIGLIFIIWSNALFLFWNKIIVRIISLILPLIFLSIFIFDGKKVESSILRESYINSMLKYEGTGYLWGGESKIGIDCSGLIRRGLIDTNLKIGFSTFNPLLLKNGLSMWYFDAGADALANQYRNLTTKLFSTKSLIELNYSSIKEGDFMVTADGLHTMAYIGNKTWIEADPEVLRVIKVKVPEDNKVRWIKVPANIMRWKQLE